MLLEMSSPIYAEETMVSQIFLNTCFIKLATEIGLSQNKKRYFDDILIITWPGVRNAVTSEIHSVLKQMKKMPHM